MRLACRRWNTRSAGAPRNRGKPTLANMNEALRELDAAQSLQELAEAIERAQERFDVKTLADEAAQREQAALRQRLQEELLKEPTLPHDESPSACPRNSKPYATPLTPAPPRAVLPLSNSTPSSRSWAAARRSGRPLPGGEEQSRGRTGAQGHLRLSAGCQRGGGQGAQGHWPCEGRTARGQGPVLPDTKVVPIPGRTPYDYDEAIER